MTSAFGVEHGVISKGLPVGLRRAGTLNNAYAQARRDASLTGHEAAQWTARARQQPERLGPTTNSVGATRAGRLARAQSRAQLETSGQSSNQLRRLS